MRSVSDAERDDRSRSEFGWHPEPELIGYRDASASRDSLERLGEATWTVALDYLYQEAMRRPVGTDTYPELRAKFFPSGSPSPAPRGPSTSAEVLAEFRERLAAYQFNAQHPRAFSYFTPPPLTMSIAGEVLAQWVNQGVDVWHAGPSAALVEEEVTGWLRDLVGFDDDGWGVLTSGGVMANIMALTVARDVHLAALLETPDEPPRGSALEGIRIYVSDQAHFSIARALDLLGFPSGTLRVIPSDDRFRLRGDPVAEAVAYDRAAGLRPLAIAAVAGSTNTGSVDLVGELADVAAREGLWLHVDAAYGGAARLSERDAGRVPDLERADSVTVDPHKWFFQSYDVGGLVIRHREDLRTTFHRSPEYYRSNRPQDEPLQWYHYSLEGTRRFRALKLWMSWKHLGTEGLGRLVERNDDLAAYLARRIGELDDFEAVPDAPELSIVCLRHLPGGRAAAANADPEALDAYQDRLQRGLEISGEGWVSTTRLRGRTYLRAGVMNYLSTEDDIDRLLGVLTDLSPAAAEGLSLG
jgi:glutamate/tyrosine decarboxylase-like PLP-dependent enzyme